MYAGTEKKISWVGEGSAGNKANSAPLDLELGPRLAITISLLKEIDLMCSPFIKFNIAKNIFF